MRRHDTLPGRLLGALLGTALPALMLCAASLDAQGRRNRFVEPGENPPFDGRVTFVRLRYETGLDGNAGFGRGGMDVPWSHDYPRGERNFTKILSQLTTIRMRTEESVVMRVNDPQLGRYPIAYMAEPGFWRPNDVEVAGLRSYLRKGGFVIFVAGAIGECPFPALLDHRAGLIGLIGPKAANGRVLNGVSQRLGFDHPIVING